MTTQDAPARWSTSLTLHRAAVACAVVLAAGCQTTTTERAAPAPPPPVQLLDAARVELPTDCTVPAGQPYRLSYTVGVDGRHRKPRRDQPAGRPGLPAGRHFEPGSPLSATRQSRRPSGSRPTGCWSAHAAAPEPSMARTIAELTAIAHRHAAAEADGDLAATLATLEPEPVYELYPVGLRMTGLPLARRYYEHFFARTCSADRGLRDAGRMDQRAGRSAGVPRVRAVRRCTGARLPRSLVCSSSATPRSPASGCTPTRSSCASCSSRCGASSKRVAAAHRHSH